MHRIFPVLITIFFCLFTLSHTGAGHSIQSAAIIKKSQNAVENQNAFTVDICIYGGTPAGVISAYAAKKMGKSVLLIEPGKHLGGIASGGLGQMDIQAKWAISGLARDFFRRVGTHYGVFEKWLFEPHVAEKVFQAYVAEARVQVLYDYRFFAAQKNENKLVQIELENAS
ncbi:MAG: FAD-dependent oxidoreductase, partial [Calditrichaeota bacterium]